VSSSLPGIMPGKKMAEIEITKPAVGKKHVFFKKNILIPKKTRQQWHLVHLNFCLKQWKLLRVEQLIPDP
jgi:hypothetical protein